MLSIYRLPLINDLYHAIANKNKTVIPNLNSNCMYFVRFKRKSNKNEPQSESKTEDEATDSFEAAILDKSTKILNVNVNSLRTDLLLKAGLGIARNKIETLFYESKIRVNGEKIVKKSAQVNVGDEIDIIKGTSPSNPKFLTVARVEVISATEKEDNISVKLRRCKSLTIDNYDDKWKNE